MKIRIFLIAFFTLSFLLLGSIKPQPVSAGFSLFGDMWCSGGPYTVVNTALGCIPTDPKAFMTILLRWGVGISSGVALLVMGYAGFLIISSQGDAKKIKAAQELFVSSVEGIALIALSVVILNFLGIQILNLGGLGFNV